MRSLQVVGPGISASQVRMPKDGASIANLTDPEHQLEGTWRGGMSQCPSREHAAVSSTPTTQPTSHYFTINDVCVCVCASVCVCLCVFRADHVCANWAFAHRLADCVPISNTTECRVTLIVLLVLPTGTMFSVSVVLVAL
jgi:hypothetical protein